MNAVLQAAPQQAKLSVAEAAARQRVGAMPLVGLNPADPQHFVDGIEGHIFDRLRAEDPVHHSRS